MKYIYLALILNTVGFFCIDTLDYTDFQTTLTDDATDLETTWSFLATSDQETTTRSTTQSTTQSTTLSTIQSTTTTNFRTTTTSKL